MTSARLIIPHLLLAGAFAVVCLASSACAPHVSPEERERMLDQGDQALAAGKLAESERYFGEVVEADPNNARAVFGLGLARLRQGSATQALAHFERARLLDPNNPDHEYLRAHTLAVLGRRAEAVDAYRALVASNPGQLQATLEMLDQMIDAGQLAEAREAVMKALDRSPRQFSLLMSAGRILGLAGSHAESVEYYKRARERRPDAPQPVYGLIEAYHHTDREKESVALIKVFEDLQARAQDLEKARQEADRDPTDPAAALRFTERLFNEGHLDEAVERSGAFLTRFPNRPETGALAVRATQAAARTGNAQGARTLLHLAESAGRTAPQQMLAFAGVHEDLGEFDEALQLYDRYLQEKPDDGRGLLGMGRTAMRLGRLELAGPPLRRSVAMMPQDAGAHAALGLLLLKTGDRQGAEAELKSALARDADQPDALFGLGFLAHQRRDNAAAEKYLKHALERRSGDQSAEVLLAMVLSDGGRCEEAIPLFTQALESDYRNMTLHLGLVRCLEQTGRTAAAAAQRKLAEQILGKRP